MKPGRELDVLIAEKVMGINVKEIMSEPGWEGLGTLYSEAMIPKYSTNISAAWQIVEKFKLGTMHLYGDGEVSWQTFYLRFNKPGIGESWGAGWERNSYSGSEWWAIGQTAQHAICLAALKRVESAPENP